VRECGRALSTTKIVQRSARSSCRDCDCSDGRPEDDPAAFVRLGARCWSEVRLATRDNKLQRSASRMQRIQTHVAPQHTMLQLAVAEWGNQRDGTFAIVSAFIDTTSKRACIICKMWFVSGCPES
jgi:hypothetical protein